MRFTVEQWSPEYGSPVSPDALEESQATVDVSPEVPADQWAPRAPASGTTEPDELAFVDGVRRVEARVWVESDRGTVHQGICASYGAGVIHCNGLASVLDARVDRGLFCDAPDLVPIRTRHAAFGVRPVPGGATGDDLSLALQGAMADLESAAGAAVPDGCLLVVDGPLRERTRLDDAVGFVKTHHVSYLPALAQEVVPALRPGQRTPLLLIGDRFRRWSWYLRLPGPRTHPWSGVVRCEVNPDRTVAEAAALADACTLALPRFASEAHKDPRAPQNLYPIGGLERELRHRLGDARLLYRSLRAAGANAAAQSSERFSV